MSERSERRSERSERSVAERASERTSAAERMSERASGIFSTVPFQIDLSHCETPINPFYITIVEDLVAF